MTINVFKITILPLEKQKTLAPTEFDELEGLAGDFDVDVKFRFLGVSFEKKSCEFS